MRSALVGYLLTMFLGITIGILVDDQLLQPAPEVKPVAPVVKLEQPPALPKIDQPVAAAQPKPADAPLAERQPAEVPTSEPGAVPKLVIESPKFDFGALERGEKTEHTFILRNVGTAPLEITKFHPDHRWLAVEVPALSIAAGQKAELKVKLDLSGEKGHLSGQILLKCNDPATPAQHLMLTGTATSRARVNPVRIDFGNVDSQEPVSKTFKVSGERGLTFQIEQTRTTNDAITADVRVVSPGHEYEVTTTLDPALLAGGDFHGSIRLMTDHPGEYHQIVVPVAALLPTRAAAVEAVAEGVPELKLVFPKFKSSDPASKAKALASHGFRIENVGTAPLIIQAVEPNASWVTAKISTRRIAPGQQAEVKVTVDAEKQAGKTGEIVVRSNDPAQPRVNVGVVPRPPAPTD